MAYCYIKKLHLQQCINWLGRLPFVIFKAFSIDIKTNLTTSFSGLFLWRLEGRPSLLKGKSPGKGNEVANLNLEDASNCKLTTGAINTENLQCVCCHPITRLACASGNYVNLRLKIKHTCPALIMSRTTKWAALRTLKQKIKKTQVLWFTGLRWFKLQFPTDRGWSSTKSLTVSAVYIKRGIQPWLLLTT